MLVYAGANVGGRDAHRPVHAAASRRHATAAPPWSAALLKAGANVDAKTTNTGATPLHLAAGAGNAEVVTALLDAAPTSTRRKPSGARRR